MVSDSSAGPAALIIGAGLMGRHHARSASAAGASIVGIVDEDLDVARALAAKWPGAEAGRDLRAVLESTGAEVAHVCSPAATHLSIGKSVANAGLHALIEKPLGVSAKETKLIHQQFATSNRLACPTHQYAFQRSVRRAGETLPRLGTLRHIGFDICSAGAAAGQMEPDELIAEILPHPLSIVQKLLPSVEVSGLAWSCLRSTGGEWLVAAAVGDTILSISLSATGRPTRFLTQITAAKGTIEIDHFHDFAVILPGKTSKARKIMGPFVRSGLEFVTATGNLLARAGRGEFAYPGLTALIGDFYKAVRSPGSEPPITPEQSIGVATARDRIAELAFRA